MTPKLYIFDLDGTLIRSFLRERPSRHGTDQEAADYDHVEVLPGRREALKLLANQEARFAIATNQAGVAFGYQTPEQVKRKLGRVLAEFDFFYGQPVTVHYVFEHPQATREEFFHANPERRKPNPGMLIEAMLRHFGGWTDLTDCVFVGDMESDRLAAHKLGMPYVDAEVFFGA
jgi:D-glycero-D-manno-heptose 1,7-bisphosphate phosphatase